MKSISLRHDYVLITKSNFVRIEGNKETLLMATSINSYSLGEEIANSITHGIGIVLAIAALGVLTAFAGIYGNVWHIVSVSIYGTTLILLYTASTLYHSIQYPRVKRILQVLDHSAIYLLIAGTYTPFTLVSLRGPWGWWLFGMIWGFAIIGVVLQLPLMRRWQAMSLGLHIGMGWAIVFAIKPLIVSVAAGGIVFLILGGLAYTTGILFYAWKKLKFHHAIWHLFVLTGSILHFFAILFYVIPILGQNISTYNRFEQVLSQFVRHVENQVLHIPSDFAPTAYDWGKCVSILEKEYGYQGHKVAFEMARTGIDGGLYKVMKRVAHHLAYDFAQNEISARVNFFWNDLSMEEKFASIDEYANKFGKFLPESYVEGSAVFLKINFTKVLEEHPRMLQRLRTTIRH